MLGEVILLFLILIGVLGHSSILAAAACILLMMKLSNLTHYFDLISRRGLELGLLFLMLSVLVPLVSNEMSLKDMLKGIFSWPGFFCALGGALATYMNGAGLSMLKIQPELMTGLVIGSIAGIVVFKGVPVGPLMSAGLAAFFMQIFNFFKG